MGADKLAENISNAKKFILTKLSAKAQNFGIYMKIEKNLHWASVVRARNGFANDIDRPISILISFCCFSETYT